MKRYLLLFVVFAFLIQPCYAAEKKKLEEYKKPDGSIVHHDVCLYTVAPNETSMYKEYYPLLDGETRSVPADTSIYVNITKSDVKTVSIRIFDESFEFYKFKYTAEDEQAPNPTVNSDLFAGKVTLLLSIVYNDDTVEEHKYYFEKIDLYNDLDLQDLKILKSDNRSGTTIAANVDGGKAVLHPEKISVKSSSGKECYSCEDGPAMLINQRLTIPFASDGLNREYTVIIPKGVILLDTGLNVEFASKIQNEIDYVVPQNYLKSMTPADGQIKYINGVSENVKFSININSGFTVDITKTISVDNKKVDYNIEKTSNGTLITFEALVEAENKYNIMFEPGIIVADNSEVSGKDYFGFSVIDLNTIDLPEKAVFTDVFVDDWAYEYITQLAVRDIISGYEDKSFKPGNKVTCAELAKILSVSFESTEDKSEYADTKTHWASKFINSVGMFIPNSGDGTFRPDEYATRQDVAIALVNIIENKYGKKLLYKECQFKDIDMIDSKYKEHVEKASTSNLILGYEDGTFRPNDNVTRAEIATLIYRSLQ